MQVGFVLAGAGTAPALSPKELHGHAVSTPIVVRRAMKRLVDIAQEVDYESKRLCTLCGARTFLPQDRQLLADRPRHAARRSAESFDLPRVPGAEGDIDEVPARGRGPSCANLVGPDRRANKCIQLIQLAAPGALPAAGVLLVAANRIRRVEKRRHLAPRVV